MLVRGKSPQLHDPVAYGAFDLDEFLAVDQLQLSNFQTRLLLGREGYQLPPGDSDTLVARAMERLESKVACFGVTEEFDRSLLLFREVLGWKSWPVYRSRNIGNPQARIQFEARHVVRIEELNRIDMVLYRLAREAFIRRLGQYGPKIEEELPCFRAALAKSGWRFAIIDLARALGKTARAIRGAWTFAASCQWVTRREQYGIESTISAGWRPGGPPLMGPPGCWCRPGCPARSRQSCAGYGA